MTTEPNSVTLKPSEGSPSFEISQVDIKGWLIDTLAEMLTQSFPNAGVKVLRGWPTDDGALPCVTVWRLNDGEGEQFVGERLEDEMNVDEHGDPDGTGNPTWGGKMAELWELRVWSLNPEQRDKIYFAVKATILLFKQELVDNDITSIRLSDGRDEAILDEHGKPMWMTPLHLSLDNPFVIKQLNVPVVTDVDVQETLG